MCRSSVIMLTVAILSCVVMMAQPTVGYIFSGEYSPSSLPHSSDDKQLTLSQIRQAVKRLQQLVDTMEPLVSSSALDSLDDSGVNWNDQEKRNAKYGPRRYDSYGVAGRFGRSVDRQLQKQDDVK